MKLAGHDDRREDPELDRILALPRVAYDESPGGVLRPAQRACVLAFAHALATEPDPVWGPPGLAALLGCGHGKTIVSLVLPALAGHPRTLHLIPAALEKQLRADEIEWTRKLPDVASPSRTIMTHEKLSSRSGRNAVFDARPELIVIDEAHGFADGSSGRWRRIEEYLGANVGTRVAILSGSLSWRSLYQSQHLLVAALRAWAPVPRGPTIAPWAACVDVAGDPSGADRAHLAPLLAWAGTSDYRSAYQDRLRSCPGVVVTGDVGAPVGLRVEAWRPDFERPAEVAEAVRRIETAWELPDGTELVSALEQIRHARTLSLGLWLRWRPETVDPDWLARRRRWASEARTLVEYAGCQTPAEAADRGRARTLRPAAQAAWDAWAAVAHLPGPETEPVWLDEGRTVRAVAAAAAHGTEPVVVWTATPAIGELAARSIGKRYFGAGSKSGPDAGTTAVASYRVLGKGWNGQAFAKSVILEPPSNGATWEQLLARLHRQGQTRDVSFRVLTWDRPHYSALMAGVRDAWYVKQTTGADQRLLLCDCVNWRRPEPETGA